jgi:hypothetical protein
MRSSAKRGRSGEITQGIDNPENQPIRNAGKRMGLYKLSCDNTGKTDGKKIVQ